MTITPALENYWKTILELYEIDGEARVTSIFERFGVDKQVSEKDACMMEHLISCETIEKLEGYFIFGDEPTINIKVVEVIIKDIKISNKNIIRINMEIEIN